MTGIVEVDVHGMNQTQAQIAIDAALRRANASVYRIRIIHGYTHNTILGIWCNTNTETTPR